MLYACLPNRPFLALSELCLSVSVMGGLVAVRSSVSDPDPVGSGSLARIRFKPYTGKIKKKKIGICSILGRIRVRLWIRVRIRIKMIRIRNTGMKGRIKCDRLAFLDDTYEESWANQNSGNTK